MDNIEKVDIVKRDNQEKVLVVFSNGEKKVKKILDFNDPELNTILFERRDDIEGLLPEIKSKNKKNKIWKTFFHLFVGLVILSAFGEMAVYLFSYSNPSLWFLAPMIGLAITAIGDTVTVDKKNSNLEKKLKEELEKIDFIKEKKLSKDYSTKYYKDEQIEEKKKYQNERLVSKINIREDVLRQVFEHGKSFALTMSGLGKFAINFVADGVVEARDYLRTEREEIAKARWEVEKAKVKEELRNNPRDSYLDEMARRGGRR